MKVKKIFLLLTIIVFCASMCGCQSSKLKEATILINEGAYSNALEILETLEKNENVIVALDECNYQLGLEEMDKGEWNSALERFSLINDQEMLTNEIFQCNYELGVQAMEESDWNTAISYFKNNSYENSQELLSECKKEKGMHEKSDYDFLNDVAVSVKERFSRPDGTAYSDLVNGELAHLDKYRNAEFYDDRLKELADMYLKGLDEQKSVAGQVLYADEQIMWQTGRVDRLTALNSLYEEYNLLQDDEEFVAAYILSFDEDRKLLDAYNDIENDLMSQVGENSENLKASFDGTDVTLEFTNNTPHEYSIGADFTFYDSNGTVNSQNSITTPIIKPGSTYNLTVYVPSYDTFYGFEFETFYINVIPGENAESEA